MTSIITSSSATLNQFRHWSMVRWLIQTEFNIPFSSVVEAIVSRVHLNILPQRKIQSHGHYLTGGRIVCWLMSGLRALRFKYLCNIDRFKLKPSTSPIPKDKGKVVCLRTSHSSQPSTLYNLPFVLSLPSLPIHRHIHFRLSIQPCLLSASVPVSCCFYSSPPNSLNALPNVRRKDRKPWPLPW